MEKYIVHDTGNRIPMGTGAIRDTQENKGRFDLISPHAMMRLAKHYENGAKKYEDRNWEKGIPASRCFSSCVRHLFQWLSGDREEDHLAAAAWNIFCILDFEHTNPDMLDTPGYDIDKEVLK